MGIGAVRAVNHAFYDPATMPEGKGGLIPYPVMTPTEENAIPSPLVPPQAIPNQGIRGTFNPNVYMQKGGCEGGSEEDFDSENYKVPEGGGGVTDNVKVGDKEVSFGHGGRHLERTGLSANEVNRVIAKDVVTKNLGTGQFYKGQLNVNGIIIEYTSYGVKDGLINIGTYYPVQ